MPRFLQKAIAHPSPPDSRVESSRETDSAQSNRTPADRQNRSRDQHAPMGAGGQSPRARRAPREDVTGRRFNRAARVFALSVSKRGGDCLVREGVRSAGWLLHRVSNRLNDVDWRPNGLIEPDPTFRGLLIAVPPRARTTSYKCATGLRFLGRRIGWLRLVEGRR